MFKKMKQYLCFAMMSLLLGGSFVLAEESLKIGVVDSKELLYAYSEQIDINALLYEEFKEKDQALIDKREEIFKKRNEIEALIIQGAEEASGRIRDLDREFRGLERDFARLDDEFEQEYTLRKNEELYKIQQQIVNAILDYAETHHYDLIIESGMAVVYSKEHLNLNQKILAELMKQVEE